MTTGVEAFLRARRDKAFTVEEAARAIGSSPFTVMESIAKAAGSDLHDLGNGAFVVTGDKEIASYRLFKQVAPYITYEDWVREKGHLPSLLVISRKRAAELNRMDMEEVRRLVES